MSKLNHTKNPITPFAVTNYRDIRRVFGIKEKNRRGHMYIIGKTGTGKTTLLENMIVSDIRDGNGLAIVDPHGDLAESLLHFIPKARIKDVIYFNPADMDHPIAFNPLESVHPDRRHLVVSGLIGVLRKAWPEFWGPRLEHILRHSILALLEYPDSTLLDLQRLLTDQEFRRNVLKMVTHQQVRNFWLLEFEKYSAWLKSDAVSPILNKIGQFVTTTPVRNIVGQKKNTFELRKVIDERKLLIVNLAKGKIGEDTSSLLGAMMVTRIQLAALSRADMPEEKRPPFYLYVDEIHSFATLSFVDVLSEARKYGLCLILAHQYVEQLDERIRAAVFGNVGTLISFRIGQEDARLLAREFAPVFDQTDLINLPNYHIYLKLMIDGVTSDAFSAVTLPSPKCSQSHKTEAIRASKQRYAKPRSEVEKEMLLEAARGGQTQRMNHTRQRSLPF
jgi:DNA helicase HerA-like ATPase